MKRFPKLFFHSASGYYCCTHDGRRRYLSKHRDEAEQRLAELIADLAVDRASARRTRLVDVSVDELIAAYLKWAEQRYVKRGRPTHELSRILGAMRDLRPVTKGLRVSEVDEFVMEQFQQRVAKRCCRTECNSRLSAAKRMFKWGVKRRLVAPASLTPILMVEGLRRGSGLAAERPTVRPVADWAVDATLESCGPVVGAMIRVQRLTGMRPIEVTHIRPCDVDCSGDVWKYRVPDDWNKLAHLEIDRTVLIGPKAQEILRPFLARPASAYCFSPAEEFAAILARRREDRRTPLPTHRRPAKSRRRSLNACYNANTYARAVAYAIRRANKLRAERGEAVVPPWSPNQLRHALATELRREHGIDAAQIQLGHTTSVMTERYARPSLESAMDAIRRIG